MCYNPVSVKYLIIADIHSNLEAFEAVLFDAEGHDGFEAVWCLGDVVGYGPNSSECIRLLRGFDPVCVCGNHDLAAIGKIDIGDFNAEAALANEWTSMQLSDEDREYLASLPESVVEGDFTLVHGSPSAPVWEYITSSFSAMKNFKYFNTQFCLVGHSHVPYYFEYDELLVQEGYLADGDTLKLGETRLIINPGGVGQPRDRDPRASYAVYDSEQGTISHYRCDYDVGVTQEKMEQAGLPGFLISRLDWGL